MEENDSRKRGICSERCIQKGEGLLRKIDKFGIIQRQWVWIVEHDTEHFTRQPAIAQGFLPGMYVGIRHTRWIFTIGTIIFVIPNPWRKRKSAQLFRDARFR